jgi:hypothetical protein
MNKLLSTRNQTDMLEGILYWLSANISEFDPASDNNLSNATPEAIKPDLTRKAIVELGLALRLAQRSPLLKKNPEIEKLKKLWVAILDSQNIFFDIGRRLQLYPHSVVAYAVLKSFGINRDDLWEDLQIVLDRGYVDRVERSAWDKLDMKYYIEAAGLNHNFSSDEELYKECSLRRLPKLPFAQTHDLYGLTHLLFHFSDFGLIDLRNLMKDDYQIVQHYVDLSQSVCLIKQDWDLTAELLINQYCLNKRFTDVDRNAAHTLFKAQQPGGFIPGRAWVKEKNEKGITADQPYSFGDVYHPTLVSMILLDCELN